MEQTSSTGRRSPPTVRHALILVAGPARDGPPESPYLADWGPCRGGSPNGFQPWSNGGRRGRGPVPAWGCHRRAFVTKPPGSHPKPLTRVPGTRTPPRCFTGHRRLLSRGRRAPRVSRTVVLLGMVSLLTDVSVGDGVHGPAAVPRVHARLHTAPVRRRGRPLPGRLGARAPRRPASPATAPAPQGGGRPSGYGLSAVCKLGLLVVGERVLGDRRAGAPRPHGQGHPHRAARRDDLAEQHAPTTLGHGLRRAPRARHHRRDARPARGLRPARHGAARVRLRSSSSASASPWWAWRCWCCSWTGTPGRPTTEAEPRRRRRCARPGGCCAIPGFARLMVVGSVLGLATISDAFIYLALEKRVDFEPTRVPAALRGHARWCTCCWRCRRGGWRTAWAAAGCSSAGTRCCCCSTGCCSARRRGLVGRAARARAAGVVLRGHGRRADGARQRAVARRHLRGTSLALLGTATSIARLLASVIFGALWVTVGMEAAIVCFGLALLAALLVGGDWRSSAAEGGAGRCLRPPSTRDRRRLRRSGSWCSRASRSPRCRSLLSAARGSGAARGRGRPAAATERVPVPRRAWSFAASTARGPGRYGALAWTRGRPGARPHLRRARPASACTSRPAAASASSRPARSERRSRSASSGSDLRPDRRARSCPACRAAPGCRPTGASAR